MNRPEFMNRTGLAYWRIGQLTLALMLLALSAATAGTRQSNLFSELATKNFRAGNSPSPLETIPRNPRKRAGKLRGMRFVIEAPSWSAGS